MRKLRLKRHLVLSLVQVPSLNSLPSACATWQHLFPGPSNLGSLWNGETVASAVVSWHYDRPVMGEWDVGPRFLFIPKWSHHTGYGKCLLWRSLKDREGSHWNSFEFSWPVEHHDLRHTECNNLNNHVDIPTISLRGLSWLLMGLPHKVGTPLAVRGVLWRR